MKAFFQIAPWALAGSLVAAFAACSSDVENSATSTSGTSASGTGGAGGETAASSSSSTGTGGAGGEDVILTCPEEAFSFETGSCDFLNQDCPPNQACIPVDPGNGKLTTKCVSWSGVKQTGSPCKTHSECQAGLFCGFYCAPPCCPTDNKPCPATCNFTVPFDFGNTASICNLAPQCELFTDNACKPGVYCHFDGNQGVATCTPLTNNIEEPTEGKACKFLNDCGDTQACIGNFCRYSCDVTKQTEAAGKGGCLLGQECIQYNPPVELYPNLGFCQPAP
ncbi:MAG: hypothetical protein HUU21_24140 [Polyangiaceae bacterium]|nr:hypothetical protein [Polyangiaceae bacterium]NUQ76643.1 hypothetical protein [Polyangiaceae bacterium]